MGKVRLANFQDKGLLRVCKGGAVPISAWHHIGFL